MTPEEIEDFELNLHQSLFHVLSDDIDDETGAKCEEVILVQHLAANPEILKHKPLKQWVDEIVGKCCLEKVKTCNEEVVQKQKYAIIKPQWKEYEKFMKGVTDRYIEMLTDNSALTIEEQSVPDYKIIDGKVIFDVTFSQEGFITCQTHFRCLSDIDGVVRTPEWIVEEWRKLNNASAVIWLNKNALSYEQFIEKNLKKQ